MMLQFLCHLGLHAWKWRGEEPALDLPVYWADGIEAYGHYDILECRRCLRSMRDPSIWYSVPAQFPVSSLR